MSQQKKWEKSEPFIFWLYVIFLFSTICSIRALTSISLASILVLGLINNKIETGSLLGNQKINLFFISCVLFYLIQAAGLIYTHDQHLTIRHLEAKSALVIIPMALSFNGYLTNAFRQRVMKYYCFIMVGAITYCLVYAILKYQSSADNSIFFYHNLVAPVLRHAIQFSIFLLRGLVFLLESLNKKEDLINRRIQYGMIMYFIFFLFLLSSKLVIIYTIVYLLFYCIRAARTNAHARLRILITLVICLAAVSTLLVTHNPISRRFYEIVTGDVGVIREKSFHPGNYFNGLQFRLLQWRFVREILNEDHAWLIGVSAGDAQAAIDKKYIEANMYVGNAAKKDHGFLGYNTHNQFLESVLQSGIPGLLVFVLICLAMILMIIRRKNAELTAVIILLLAYSFNESVFETQYGLILFTFFPLFLFRSFSGEMGETRN